MSLIKAKKIVGNKIIGITCHNSIKLAKVAIKKKASYIAFGAFFSTKTKNTKYRATIKILHDTSYRLGLFFFQLKSYFLMNIF